MVIVAISGVVMVEEVQRMTFIVPSTDEMHLQSSTCVKYK